MDNRFMFRGKRKENNKDNSVWLYGCLQVVEDASCGQVSYYIHSPRGGRMNHMHLAYPDTIGQCTGLSAAKSYRGDKPEDLLIWEKDKLFSDDWLSEWVVYWDDERAGWFCYNIADFTECEPLDEVLAAGSWIFGNAHDD